MTEIAFAIVVAACLFAPGDHHVLYGFSVFGLWLAAFCPSALYLHHKHED